MSLADIRYMPLTTDPSRQRRDIIPELTQASIWLEGGLHEARRGRKDTERMIVAQTAMLAVTVTLLVLTWAGYIPIGRW